MINRQILVSGIDAQAEDPLRPCLRLALPGLSTFSLSWWDLPCWFPAHKELYSVDTREVCFPPLRQGTRPLCSQILQPMVMGHLQGNCLPLRHCWVKEASVLRAVLRRSNTWAISCQYHSSWHIDIYIWKRNLSRTPITFITAVVPQSILVPGTATSSFSETC